MKKEKIKYQIFFGINKGNNNDPNKEDILEKDLEIKENFEFNDYNLDSTKGNLKEYFLTTFIKIKMFTVRYQVMKIRNYLV